MADRRAAQAAGLAGELVDFAPGAIVTSSYLRALQTLEPAAEILGVSIRIDEQLREWDSGIAPTSDYERRYEESGRARSVHARQRKICTSSPSGRSGR